VKSEYLKKILITFIVCLLFSSALFFVIGCDESLPPRNDPNVLFKCNISWMYEYYRIVNDLKFFIDVTNIYHETVEDTAYVNGTLEVILKRDPRYHKTISLSISNLSTTPMYNQATGCFTIDPMKYVTFTCRWDYIDDNQVDLRSSVFEYSEDPACPARLKSQPETYILKGWIQISKWGGTMLIGPIEISTFHVTPYVVNISCLPY
jgi:hypothetical protein